jgi:hypothetical protein
MIALVAGSKGGVTFLNIIQTLRFFLILNVMLPQNFVYFMSIFSKTILDYLPPVLRFNSNLKSSANSNTNSSAGDSNSTQLTLAAQRINKYLRAPIKF